jgi:SNF2 family DNA or RNA helicase
MTGFFKEVPPYYEHQQTTLDLLGQKNRVLDLSDPGTGKTRPALGAFIERLNKSGKRGLVLAPKSILQPAWGDDIDKFFPGVQYDIAYANVRKRVLEKSTADIIITNHDAVRALVGKRSLVKPAFWKDFDTIVIDESTAFKNHTSQRSKALYNIAKQMEYRECMTGTPNPKSILDIWHQAKIVDDGERLGTSYWKFRSAVCEPVQVGPRPEMTQWVDKEGAEYAVFDMLEDISIRHKFEECTDIPPNSVTEYRIDLAPKLRKQYADMCAIAATMLADGKFLMATNAASVHQKLMQMASGAVYTEEGEYSVLDDQRSELVMDLIEERQKCVVAFNWRHQRAGLEAAASKRGIKYGVIDGSVNDRVRREVVEQFQNGELRAIFAHPQSAGHGLTLTAGTTTIWTSPTYNAEHYKQFNHRIYRSGQTQRTETIHITARDTIDEKVFDKLGSKLTSMQLLLDLLEK